MYDAMGNRVYKSAVPNSGTLPGDVTHYVRDATGNVMAIYQADPSTPSTLAKVQYPLYGSSRVGVANYTLPYTLPTTSFNRTLNYKAYELNDHLGNVMVNVADWQKGYDNNADGIADIYRADHSNGADYYPFGMIMPGRNNPASNTYRFGFNGKEKDDQIEGNNNTLDFNFRSYNSRLGRFMSVDPIAKNYAWNSPYAFAENKLGLGIELEGLELLTFHSSMFQMRYTGKYMEVKIISLNVPKAIRTPQGDLVTFRGAVGTEGHDPVSTYSGGTIDNANYHRATPVYLYGDARDNNLPNPQRSGSSQGTQQDNIDNNLFARSLLVVKEIGRNILNTSHIPQWFAGGTEAEHRQAFYTATNAYNQSQLAIESSVPENMRPQLKADVINYVTDGTLPKGTYVPGPNGSLGTITYTPDQASYIQNVIKIGNSIISQIPGAEVNSDTEKNNSYIPKEK